MSNAVDVNKQSPLHNRGDAVVHQGRWYVPTIYGQRSGNTVWVDSIDQLRTVGGRVCFSEDQTTVTLVLPVGHKFSIKLFEQPAETQPPGFETAVTRCAIVDLAVLKRIAGDLQAIKDHDDEIDGNTGQDARPPTGDDYNVIHDHAIDALKALSEIINAAEAAE